MKTLKAKLTALFMTIGCFAVCLGTGVAIATQLEATQVTASAAGAEVHELGKFDLHVNSSVGGAAGVNSQLYLARADGGALPIQTWDKAFTIAREGSFKINGVPFTSVEIKSTGDGFWVNFGAVDAGAVVTLDGIFVYADDTMSVKYIIEESSFKWTGSGWVVLGETIDYTSYNISTIAPAGGCTDSVVYAYPTVEAKPENASWDYKFTFKAGSGSGICLNGEQLSGYEIKQPGDFYIVLGKAAVAGDVLTIDGFFYNDTIAKAITFNNSSLVYDGSAWATNDAGVANTFTITEIGATGDSTNAVVYPYPVDETQKPTTASWDHKYTFVADSGEGITLNGAPLTDYEMKQPGDFYIVLGKTAVAGDVLILDGIFYSADANARMIFCDSTLRYNGTTWETYNYINDTYVGKVVPTAYCNASQLYLLKENGEKFIDRVGDDAAWADFYSFDTYSGVGVTLNGESVLAEAKVPNDLFIGLSKEAKVGDILVVEGAFYNNDLNVRYVVDKTELEWTGSAWVECADYTTYTFNELGGANGCTDSVIYAYPTEGDSLPAGDWDNKFALVSGAGLKLNDTVLEGWEIKQPGDFYIVLNTTASKGDVFTIDGTFINNATAKKFVFNNCKLEYNGTTWVTVKNYTTYDLGKVVAVVDGNASGGYLQFAAGVTLPVSSWDYAFMLFSGKGITVDGELIDMTNNVKSVGDKLYVTLTPTPASVDSILSISGTFYNEALAVKYVVEESKFIFNGTTWSDLQSSYTISNLQPTASSTEKAPVYLKINGDTNLPIISDAYTFDHTDGAGFVRDGSQLKMTTIKSTADGFNFKFAKPSSIAAGEVFTLSGTFYCEELDVTLIIEECTITWTGSAWEVYYTTFTINKLGATGDSTASFIYAYPVEGDALVKPGDWDNRYSFEEGSGTGLKLNGVALSGWEIKQPGDLYIVLGKTAVNGDEFTIDGTFYNETTAKKYVFDNCTLVFDGTTWSTKADTSGYTTYNIGELILHVNSSTGAASGNNNQLYLQRADGEALPFMSWANADVFTADEDGYFKVNGNTITASEIKSTDAGLFFLFPAASAGTVITIGGTFVCDAQSIKYVIEESKFVWTGSGWALVGKDYSDLIAGVGYDTVTIVSLGFGVEERVTGLVDGAGLSYVASAGNTTGSLKFRLGINAADMSAGAYDIRFRGAAWDGIRFILGNGQLQSWYSTAHKSVALNSNTYYEIEIGLIDTADGNSIWLYAKVNDVLYISDLVAKTDKNAYDEMKAFGDYNTTHISFYGNLGTATLYDPDRTTVTYTTEFGTHTEYAERNADFTFPQGKTYEAFIGWLAEDGTIYKAGDPIWLDGSMSFTAISIDFFLEDGAAIRLSDSADNSGIRFTTYISEADLTTLASYGITVNSYGTLIMPFDYLGAGQAPNLADFTVEEKTILKIPSTYSETEDDYVVYRGAMQKLDEGNYGRLFAGRGYMEITVNGETRIVYTPFDYNENVRSIRYIAQEFQKDTDEYNKISNTKKEVVDVYASINEIKLLNYDKYANNNFLNLIAWYYPELDPSNAYENATNIAIAQKIKAAGMTAVYLDGEYHLDLSDTVNVEKTRQIINFFWNQGLKTIAFGSNASTNLYLDYSTNSFPDFSDCEGFMGYLVWDEPQEGSFGTLAAFANNFETVYAGTGVNFMVNLLPSYATMFNSGSSSWWESSLTTLNEASYKDYVKNYCDTVLSQIDGGEKWLSMDSYPINADQSLTGNFLFDLAVLKYYAMEYDAHAHAALQSSGWEEGGNTSKNRMPTEAEMRMQAYTAMAFGVDSISWWSYSDKRNDNQQNPTDNDEYYTRFANVNKELSAISAIYSAFEWQGVILGSGKDNGNLIAPDEDYEAYNVVKGQIGDYELSVSDTKLLSGVSTNKTNWNYLMGVMQDLNGNEAYVLSNYNSHEEDRAQTITLTFDKNVTEVIIYRGGVAQTVSVSNKTLAISLATGEGVIVLPSKIG